MCYCNYYRSFVPPSDYTKIASIPCISSKSLEDKEFWLIELPSTLDVSKLQSLPISSDFTGSTSATINGESYSLTSSDNHTLINPGEDIKLSSLRLIAPVGEGDSTKTFTLTEKSISKVIRVTPDVKIPEIDYDKEIQPQPEVKQLTEMKLRHFASGYGPEHESESEPSKKPAATSKKLQKKKTDSEKKSSKKMPKKISKPEEIETPSKVSSKKRSKANGNDGTEPPEKKRKKEKSKV